MQKLVLDLRNNGGGLLDQAIEVSDQFLPKGAMIVETGAHARLVPVHGASGKHPTLDVPVVVLVNEGTASASEIVSAPSRTTTAA